MPPQIAQTIKDIRVIDLPDALADPATPAADRSIYAAALQRISGYLGGASDGLAIGG